VNALKLQEVAEEVWPQAAEDRATTAVSLATLLANALTSSSNNKEDIELARHLYVVDGNAEGGSLSLCDECG
jgi:hypothetical protein